MIAEPPSRRIAVWSGPRNLSTALMRSFSSRADTVVVDEPFYACYLASNSLPHPGRDEVIATHVFLVRDGVVITSTTRACPEGITRAAILELCHRHGQASETRHVPAEELAQADEMFVTGTMGEVTPVARLDDRHFGQIPGAVTRRVSEWFRQLVRDPAEGTPVVPDRT